MPEPYTEVLDEESQSPDVVTLAQSRLERLEKIRHSQADKARRESALKHRTVYEGDKEPMMRMRGSLPHEDAEIRRDKPFLPIRFYTHLVQRLSGLYDRPVQRRTGDPDLDAELEKLLWSPGGWDRQLQRASAMALVGGAVHMLPIWDEGSRVDKDHVKLRVYTADAVVVLPAEDVSKPEAILVRHRASVDRSTEYHYWDASVWGRLKVHERGATQNLEVLEWIEHGYEELPVIVSRWTEPDDCYWPEPWGGEALLESIGAILLLLSEIAWSAIINGRGQVALSSATEIDGQVRAPDVVFRLGDNGSATLLSDTSFLAMMQTVQTLTDMIVITEGLPAGTLQVTASQAQSGVAIALEAVELEEWQTAQQSLWSMVERQLTATAARVYALDRTRSASLPDPQWPDPVITTVDYPPRVMPLSAGEERARANDLREAGLLGAVDYYARLTAGATTEDAERAIERRREEEEARREAEAELPSSEKIQETALNGAQVQAFVQVLQSVSAGEIAAEAALVIIQSAFPAVAIEEAQRAVTASAEQAANRVPEQPTGVRGVLQSARAQRESRQQQSQLQPPTGDES